MVSNKAEYMRKYMKKYSEQKQNVVVCECGGKYKEMGKYRHQTTAKHQNFINGIEKPRFCKKQLIDMMDEMKIEIENLKKNSTATNIEKIK